MRPRVRARPDRSAPHPMAVLNGMPFGRPRPAPPPPPPPPPPPDPHARAAQYLRMSTEHQVYSTTCQQDAIAKFAADYRLEIVRTYSDDGKSGLDADHRPGLLALLNDVTRGAADFRTILVFDVSRWGRFQDCDESAHYEYLCRRAGIRVEYCSEPFRNDQTAMSMVMKHLKRVMAAEYSRELAAKISAAKRRIAGMGYRMGGSAGYGLRRMMIDAQGRPVGALNHGQEKHLQEYRVILVPGPAEEVRIVRWAFQKAASGWGPTRIARGLARRGVVNKTGKPWCKTRMMFLLANEKYIGNVVFARTKVSLTEPKVWTPPETWVRHNGAFQGIIAPELFRRAQDAISRWTSRIPSDEALRKLRRLFERHGHLSAKLINSAPDMPGSVFYEERFGGLIRAYALVGFEPDRDYRFLSGYGQRKRRGEQLREQVASAMMARGMRVKHRARALVMVCNGVRVAVQLALKQVAGQKVRWVAQCPIRHKARWLIIARTFDDGVGIRDYWLTQGGHHLFRLGSKLGKGRSWRRAGDFWPLLDIIEKSTRTTGRTAAAG
jgi:DNA invertase Pin-like site-specific DNA recombinase